MTIEAELPDGTILEFPDGTDPSVIQRTARGILEASQPEDPSPTLSSFIPGARLIQDIQDIGEQGFERG